MGNYVFERRTCWWRRCRKDADDDRSQHSIGGDIIPMLVRERGRACL